MTTHLHVLGEAALALRVFGPDLAALARRTAAAGVRAGVNQLRRDTVRHREDER